MTLRSQKKNHHEPVRWKDIKNFPFEDEDILRIGYVEEWENGSDNSGGDYYEATVMRPVLETDEAFTRRVQLHEDFKATSRKRRLEEFEKLKKEFEP